MHNPIEDEIAIATKVAYRFGRRWELVDEDDLANHLTLWLFENQAWLKESRSSQHGIAQLYVALKREAAKYCAAETAARVGQRIEAGRFYSVKRIRRVLPFIFEGPPTPTVREDPITGEVLDVYESSAGAEVLLDVTNAYYDLPPKSRSLIALRYRDGLSHREIAELQHLTIEAGQTAIYRAIKRMSDYLEGNNVGTRG